MPVFAAVRKPAGLSIPGGGRSRARPMVNGRGRTLLEHRHHSDGRPRDDQIHQRRGDQRRGVGRRRLRVRRLLQKVGHGDHRGERGVLGDGRAIRRMNASSPSKSTFSIKRGADPAARDLADAPDAGLRPEDARRRFRAGGVDLVACVDGRSLAHAYSATKAAVHGMARTWAHELGPDGITVNVVAPGSILTDNFWGHHPQGFSTPAASGRPVAGAPPRRGRGRDPRSDFLRRTGGRLCHLGRCFSSAAARASAAFRSDPAGGCACMMRPICRRLKT